MPLSLSQLFASAWSGWLATWPTELLALIWIGWLVSWIAGSFWSARTAKRPVTWRARAHRLPVIIGGLLLTPWTAQLLAERPLWKLGNGGIYVLAAIVVAGLLFTWWARIHLGRFWSNEITRKEGHRVIDTGPYGFVRHPIYTGLIAAILATGMAVGTATAILGAVLISFGLSVKARAEENFLTAELDPSAYDSYRRRVPMLVPFLPRR
ncbi:MAG TPA: isoprenylcysteine carboxylmethyltransferase family protein [Pseudolabrys sp.]|nr:isoprenylcysteine carboxylmethyltransferase family protein [Pseudolabrys sp.]